MSEIDAIFHQFVRISKRENCVGRVCCCRSNAMRGISATGQRVTTMQGAALVVVLVVGTGTWCYLFGVFLPYQRIYQPQGIAQTNQSDLYPRWVGAQEVILHGRNPYGPGVTREIQLGYYGRAVDEDKLAVDQQR